ncbi:SDR family NAD(P)-dependent oxidoreductase, partial [Asaia sp. SF2.1]
MQLPTEERPLPQQPQTRVPGIGAAIVCTLAQEGAVVAVHGRDAVRTGRVVDSITAKGGIAIAVLGDLTDNNTAASLVCEVNERLGGLDILFNNAGGG